MRWRLRQVSCSSYDDSESLATREGSRRLLDGHIQGDGAAIVIVFVDANIFTADISRRSTGWRQLSRLARADRLTVVTDEAVVMEVVANYQRQVNALMTERVKIEKKSRDLG